ADGGRDDARADRLTRGEARPGLRGRDPGRGRRARGPRGRPGGVLSRAGVAEAQVAALVTSCVVASSKKPVATSWTSVPLAIEGVDGVTAIETRFASVTVSVVMPLTAPSVAEITDVPGTSAVARPRDASAFEIV